MMFQPCSHRLRRLLRVATAATLSLCAALPAAQAATTPAKPKFTTVVIDAGHGGHDRGAVRPIAGFEKTLALDVAKRLEKELANTPLRTVMTRDDDTFVSLPDRCKAANAENAAVFVSIHFNVGERLAARGFETFFSSFKSADLANDLHAGLLRTTESEDRGVKRRGFYVLKNTDIPAVLVECGFMSNAEEAKLIATGEFRQKLAEELAAALLENAGMPEAT